MSNKIMYQDKKEYPLWMDVLSTIYYYQEVAHIERVNKTFLCRKVKIDYSNMHGIIEFLKRKQLITLSHYGKQKLIILTKKGCEIAPATTKIKLLLEQN